MGLFSGDNDKPAWIAPAREFCRTNKIAIAAWGPQALVVEARSPERAREIANQLSQLGFKAVESEDDASAGLLTLSPNPGALQANIVSFDISRRPWSEQVEPFVWALGSLLLVPGRDGHSGRHVIYVPIGIGAVLLFVWDAMRIWGWRLELLPGALRVRRRFRWTSIPWSQIRTIESKEVGKTQERVTALLNNHQTEVLGTFLDSFARNLRDCLRHELAKRNQ